MHVWADITSADKAILQPARIPRSAYENPHGKGVLADATVGPKAVILSNIEAIHMHHKASDKYGIG